MPLDPVPNPDGYWVKVELRGNDRIVHRLNREESNADTRKRYTSHFETCPYASQHSKKNKR